MIQLLINPYCEECGDFEADTEKEEYCDFYGDVKYNTSIFCKYRKRCENIRDYLRERARENDTRRSD